MNIAFATFGLIILALGEQPSRTRVYMEYGISACLLSAISLELLLLLIKTVFAAYDFYKQMFFK